MAKRSRFGVGYVLNGTSPEITTSHRLDFAETAGAWFLHTVNPLQHTQDRTFWGSGSAGKMGSSTPTGSKVLPLNREREAEKSLNIRPENRAYSGTVRSYGS